ncbi:hypothetical protein CASFOL_007835 [Castilleja foliolosa]|uniref:ATP synthase CF0 subunit I n=1 Tax=Castilleja foliolosa TaxID=1961234 RepID=A0ABD3E1T0_9LAMI
MILRNVYWLLVFLISLVFTLMNQRNTYGRKDNLLSLSDLLDNRKQRILNTIRNSEELRGGAIEQLEKAKARLRKVEIEADQFRVNGYSEIEREKLNLVNSTYKTLEQLENYKNETIQFEQQRAINQVRQRIFHPVWVKK